MNCPCKVVKLTFLTLKIKTFKNKKEHVNETYSSYCFVTSFSIYVC